MLLFFLPWITHEIREQGFRRAAERMQPLVFGITRFEREHGAPPAALHQLAPEYVSDVGAFGVRGCRPLEYQRGGGVAQWELRLQCPNGWLALDQFFYRPGEHYAEYEHIQRMHAWAYFWD